MTKLLVGWLVSAAALFAIAHFKLIPGIHVTGPKAAIIGAIVVGLANGTIGAVIKFLAFPIRILTLGLASLVINGLMVLIAAAVVDGFKVEGIVPAILCAIVLSVAGWLGRAIVGDGKSKE